MRPRELFRGPMGLGVDGGGQRVLGGQGGRLGDPMGPWVGFMSLLMTDEFSKRSLTSPPLQKMQYD